MYVRMILTDLDGTLLRTDKTVSELSLKAFELCRQRGIMIAVATARSEQSAGKYLELLKPDAVISNGGATVSCGGKNIHKALMNAETVNGIIQMCKDYTNGAGEITVEAEDGYYWNYKERPDPLSDYGYAVYSDFESFYRAAYKITAELEKEEYAEKIAAAYPECSYLSFRGEKWRRFALRGADKASAARKLCEYMGISLEDTAAFGDDGNDAEMLEICGIGVAMGNAVQSVKAAADFVCASNDEDGAARFILEKILT